MSTLSEKIKELRALGMSYKKIAAEVSCSTGTVSYYVGEGQQEKTIARTRRRRRETSAMVKESHGGKCVVCGYDTCLAALEFDHLDPSKKLHPVSHRRSNAKITASEAEKCILLCCRCHRERHAGLIDIGAYLEPDV